MEHSTGLMSTDGVAPLCACDEAGLAFKQGSTVMHTLAIHFPAIDIPLNSA